MNIRIWHKNYNKHVRKIVHRGMMFKMATQIAPTPILYGQDALNVMEDLKRIPTERSKENGKKLVEYFEKFMN